MNQFVVFFIILMLLCAKTKADAIVHIRGTVPDKGYTIQNGYVIPSAGYTITINGVQTATKVKLTPNVDYTILVEAL